MALMRKTFVPREALKTLDALRRWKPACRALPTEAEVNRLNRENS